MPAKLLRVPFAGALVLTSLLSAQSPVTIVPGTLPPGVVMEDLPPEVAAAMAKAAAGQVPAGAQDPAADPAKAAADQKAAKRLAAFKKLVFDRRPSSILKAWAAPELKPYDPKEEEAKEAAKKAAENGGAKAAGKTGAASSAGAVDPQTVAGAPAPGAPTVVRSIPLSGTTTGTTTTLRLSTAPPAPVSSTAQPVASGAMTSSQIQALINEEAEAKETPTPAAAGAKPVAAGPAKPKVDAALEAKILKREMEMLARDVTLSRWEKVGEFLASLPEKDQKAAYEQLVKVLPRHPNKPPSRLPSNLQERNRFEFDEVFVLAGMAPKGLDKKQVKLLAPIAKRVMDDGSVTEELIRMLGIEATKPDEVVRINRRNGALLLSALKLETELGPFLPTATKAEKDNDREALNMLARHALAMYAKEKRHSWLETAWQVTQSALAKGEIGKEEKEEALRRAVELAPKVAEDLGPEWLAASFTARPERGMEIVATIGGQVATGFQKKGADTKYRADGLLLQKTAVEALLSVAPKLAEKWKPTLSLLASGWIQEAEHSKRYSKTTSYGSYMERDIYGNIFWNNRRMGGGSGRVQSIEPDDVMKSQPNAKWASLLDDALLPHFTTVSAQIWLKVNEYEKAFPYIEQLASINPRKAHELANEFLRVWQRNNNPNTNSRTNSYMFMYGFETRANSIPLTRSKQERNLKELGKYVERLRALPIKPVDAGVLTNAFYAAHSTAEVYRVKTIEQVFGKIADLDPVVLGQLIGKMRQNLATVWRIPAVQEASKTRRSQKEMMAEVSAGYGTALKLAQDSVTSKGRHWALLSAVATLLHDKNNFDQEQQKSSDFADIRKTAFELFAEAADHYSSIADGLTIAEETDSPYTLWFYSALGSADLGAVEESMVVAKSQLPLIKEALAELPDDSRERHETKFASLLFTRMSAVKPQIKFRYLQAGFEIVGEHEQAKEAQKVWQYYQDLLGELRLESVVDGSTEVGIEPFGVRVDLVHTREISRESGGFQKYATNQNNMAYAYNYGRPTENYRDKFQEAALQSLRENFEVLSVTFNSENMEALVGDEPGWQRTPYAYMLLKARGPQVDHIPPIKIDLDFLDTSGFTILPIGSDKVAINAAADQDLRPFEDVEVTQLLDERRVDEGKITLEIKAKSKGLVPDLEQILKLETPGFIVKNTDDQGAAVMRFSPDQDGIESERVWLLAMEPEESTSPGNFRFAEPAAEGVNVVYQRYNDADLETVSANIALRRGPIGTNPAWAWVLLGLATVAYFLWFFIPSRRSEMEAQEEALRMPEQVTAFSVLALLQRIRGASALDPGQAALLEADMHRIEANHFGKKSGDSMQLDKIAGDWLKKAL